MNSEILAAHRSALGLSQSKMAERWGVPLRTYQDIEQGKRRANDGILRGALYDIGNTTFEMESRFWSMVDAKGLADVPSDMWNLWPLNTYFTAHTTRAKNGSGPAGIMRAMSNSTIAHCRFEMGDPLRVKASIVPFIEFTAAPLEWNPIICAYHSGLPAPG